MQTQKTIGIIGANGFIGSNLIKHFLTYSQNNVIGLYHDNVEKYPELLDPFFSKNPRFKAVSGDVFDLENLQKQLTGVSTAYYLIHMMARKDRDFYALETKAAENFAKAAKQAGVERIIYLGGLGNDHDLLSKHLSSRHNTGNILREFGPEVIEFRASMVIGVGSIAFDILANIAQKLPILILPMSVKTKTQPIGLPDVLLYLTAATEILISKNEIIEIGGPEIISYEDLIKKYISSQGLKTMFFKSPFLPELLDGFILNIFTPKGHAQVGKNMIETLRNQMIVTNNRAQVLFPQIKPQPIEILFQEKISEHYK